MPHEVVIGTSDVRDDEANSQRADTPNPLTATPPQQPSLATLEAYVQDLRYELCGDRHAPRGYAAHVRVGATDLTRISRLVDLLDQLRYWGIEESTTFLREPSGLAEVEAPEVVVACVCSGRPALMTQALTVLQVMLPHRQTAWELRRVTRAVLQARGQTMPDPSPVDKDPKSSAVCDDICLEHERNWIHMNTNCVTATSKKSREEQEEESKQRQQRVCNPAKPAVQPPEAEMNGDPLLILLADIMQRHAGAAPLLTEAIRTATAVTQAVLTNKADAAATADAGEESSMRFAADVNSVVDSLYETPLVFLIESAMRRFGDVGALQVCGVQFFATLVDLPMPPDDDCFFPSTSENKRDVHSGNRPETTSGVAGVGSCVFPQEEEEEAERIMKSPAMSDIIAHSDGILAVLTCAMQRHHQNLALCRAVLRIWCVCAQQPANRLPLLRHGVYAFAVKQLAEVGPYTMDVFHASAEIVGYFMPLLDVLQRRTLLWTLRGILQRRPQLEMIELVLALLVALLTVVASNNNSNNDDKRYSNGDGADESGEYARAEVREDLSDGAAANLANTGSRRRDPYAMYAHGPQPPLTQSESVAATLNSAAHTAEEKNIHSSSAKQTKLCRLQLSPLYFQPQTAQSSPLRKGEPASSRAGATLTDSSDTWEFMLQHCALPQLVSGIHTYFRTCEVVDEKDAAEVQRVCTLAEGVLSFF